MGKIPVKGEMVSVLWLTPGKNISEYTSRLYKKMPEYNVSKYCLIPWSQYRGMQPESQLTTDIQQKLCGE